MKKDIADDANVKVDLYNKISEDLVLMIAKDKLKRFVEARREEERKAVEEAEVHGGKEGKGVRATTAKRLHAVATDEYPHRFMAPDYFRGQLGLKDLASVRPRLPFFLRGDVFPRAGTRRSTTTSRRRCTGSRAARCRRTARTTASTR